MFNHPNNLTEFYPNNRSKISFLQKSNVLFRDLCVLDGALACSSLWVLRTY